MCCVGCYVIHGRHVHPLVMIRNVLAGYICTSIMEGTCHLLTASPKTVALMFDGATCRYHYEIRHAYVI